MHRVEGYADAAQRQPKDGWTSFIIKLAESCQSSAHAMHHAREVREASRLRALRAELRKRLDECDDVRLNGSSDSNHVEELIERAEAGLFKTTESVQSTTSDRASIGQGLTDAAERACRGREAVDANTVRLGLPTIDRALGGLRPGRMTVLAARPKIGKTTVAIQIALNAAKAGRRVLFCSCEMGTDELSDRTLANLSGVRCSDITSGSLTPAEQDAVRDAAAEYRELPIQFEAMRAGTAVATVRSRARRHARNGLDLLVIDYLQLLKVPGHRDRFQEVGAISTTLKALARELNVPIIALAQLGRQAEGRMPLLSDLRESGSIEQGADAVIGIWRSGEPNPLGLEALPETSMIVMGNRHGPGDVVVELDLDPALMRTSEKATVFTSAVA